MTQQPEQEYRITHEQAVKMWEHIRDCTIPGSLPSWFWCEMQNHSHPIAAATPLTNTQIIRCKKSDCIDYNTDLCHPWKCSHAMKHHDAAIRREERERVLDDVGKILNNRIAKMVTLKTHLPSEKEH